MGCSRVVVTAGATIALGFAGASAAGAASTTAQPYVTLPSVLVTNVGQHPQLVGQYGNRGGTTLNNVTFECHVVSPVGGAISPDLSLVSGPFRNPFMPGQNANFQYVGTALRAGVDGVQCTVSGVEAGTNIPRTAVSNVATIQVNR